MKKYLPKKSHVIYKEELKIKEENKRLKREHKEKEELRAKGILDDLWLELNRELTNYIIYRDKIAVNLSKEPKNLNIIITDFDIINEDIEREERNRNYINQDCIKYKVKNIKHIYYDQNVYAEYLNSSVFWSETKFRNGETFIIIYRFVYSILYRNCHDLRYYYIHFYKTSLGRWYISQDKIIRTIDYFFENTYNIDYQHFVDLTFKTYM